MAKIAYASVILVVVLLSMPSILNADSDFMIETTGLKVDNKLAMSDTVDEWFKWMWGPKAGLMGTGDYYDEAVAGALASKKPEKAEAPAFAPSSWTLRHL
ncbi:hypothetical protein Tsubulata_016225 [Turnera subulata]|uniref:Uncharacterized protein n=1 Tax=Turnera subulata TaxID=218843 RepID=A0A9Q0JP43_9ROSI|nr:hypothetical protein Tsubulata_016225 [Turnera subulata]